MNVFPKDIEGSGNQILAGGSGSSAYNQAGGVRPVSRVQLRGSPEHTLPGSSSSLSDPMTPLGTPGGFIDGVDQTQQSKAGIKNLVKCPSLSRAEKEQRFQKTCKALYELIVSGQAGSQKKNSNQTVIEAAQRLIETFEKEGSIATSRQAYFQWNVFAYSLLILSCSLVAGYCIFYMKILPMTPLYLSVFGLLLSIQFYDQILQWWGKRSDKNWDAPNSGIDRFSGSVSIVIATCLAVIAAGGVGYGLCFFGGFGLYTLQGSLCFLLPLVLLAPHLKLQWGRFIRCCKGAYYQGLSTRVDTDNLGRVLGYVKALIVVFRTIIAFILLDNGVWLTWGWLSWPALIGFSILSITQLWESYLYTNMWYSPTVDDEQKDFTLTHLVSSLHDLLDAKTRQEHDLKYPSQEAPVKTRRGPSISRGWLANIVGLAGTILVIFVPIIVNSSGLGWYIGGAIICGLDFFQRLIAADYLYGDSQNLKILNSLKGKELDVLKKVPLSAVDMFKGLSYFILMVSTAISSLWAGKNKFYTLFLGFLPLIFTNINVEYYSICLSVAFVLISLTSTFLNQHKSMKQYLQILRLEHCLLAAGWKRIKDSDNRPTVQNMRARGYSDKQLKILNYSSKAIDACPSLAPEKRRSAQLKELKWWCCPDLEGSEEACLLEDSAGHERCRAEGLDAEQSLETSDRSWMDRAEVVMALLNRNLKKHRPYLSSETMKKPHHKKWWLSVLTVVISIITREVSHFSVVLLFLNMIPFLTPFPHFIDVLAIGFVCLDVIAFYYNAQKSLRHYDICLKTEAVIARVNTLTVSVQKPQSNEFHCHSEIMPVSPENQASFSRLNNEALPREGESPTVDSRT